MYAFRYAYMPFEIQSGQVGFNGMICEEGTSFSKLCVMFKLQICMVYLLWVLFMESYESMAWNIDAGNGCKLMCMQNGKGISY